MASDKSFKKCAALLKKELSKKRFHHSLCVSELAGKLAKRHNANVVDAKKAGLLHDCAKEWSPKKLSSYVRRHRISVPHLDFIRRVSPNVLHAYAGAHWAQSRGWLKNREALRAISSHTLGRIRMGKLEKILYVADFSSTDRTYSSAKKIRKLAKKNLDRAFREAVQTKIYYQLLVGRSLHPLTVSVWNHLCRP